MSFSLAQLQEEQVSWVKHNFGDRPSWMPLLGVAEELGELVEAATRLDHDEVRDAIADCIIFLADYCTGMGWDLQQLWDARTSIQLDTDEHARKMIVAVAKMQHHHLKLHQGIRGNKDKHTKGGQLGVQWLLYELVWVFPWVPTKTPLLGDLARKRSDAVIDAVATTWAKVRQRDWKKNPHDPGEHA